MSFLNEPQYAGILHALDPCAVEDPGKASPDAPSQDEIDDDIEGEKETLDLQDLPVLEYDEKEPADSESESGDGKDEDGDGEDEDGDTKMPDLTLMRAVITEASKGVVDGTDAEYKR
jgi:hypothetical protein